MRVKITNKTTKEFEIKEVTEFTDNSITQQVGKGIMVQSFNPEEFEIVREE